MPRLIDHDVRRAELAEALWRVVARDGIAAVSVRGVAAEAGLATGSLRHVFPTRAELLVFSAELMMQQSRARIQALPPARDLASAAMAALTELLPLSDESRVEHDVTIAIIAESAALPELIEVRDRAAQALQQACAHMVGMLHPASSDEQRLVFGQRLHALVDGLALHLRMQDADADPSWALNILRAEVDFLQRLG